MTWENIEAIVQNNEQRICVRFNSRGFALDLEDARKLQGKLIEAIKDLEECAQQLEP